MSDHVAIFTGASRGIGPHIAGALADAGHPVVLVARTTSLIERHAAEKGMSVRAIAETGVAIPNDGAVVPDRVARAVVAAIGGGQPEIYVGAGSRFMTRHPRLAYRLMRKGGVFDALEQAAGEDRRQRPAA